MVSPWQPYVTMKIAYAQIVNMYKIMIFIVLSLTRVVMGNISSGKPMKCE